jgi:hypothetical protein
MHNSSGPSISESYTRVRPPLSFFFDADVSPGFSESDKAGVSPVEEEAVVPNKLDATGADVGAILG